MPARCLQGVEGVEGCSAGDLSNEIGCQPEACMQLRGLRAAVQGTCCHPWAWLWTGNSCLQQRRASTRSDPSLRRWAVPIVQELQLSCPSMQTPSLFSSFGKMATAVLSRVQLGSFICAATLASHPILDLTPAFGLREASAAQDSLDCVCAEQAF